MVVRKRVIQFPAVQVPEEGENKNTIRQQPPRIFFEAITAHQILSAKHPKNQATKREIKNGTR